MSPERPPASRRRRMLVLRTSSFEDVVSYAHLPRSALVSVSSALSVPGATICRLNPRTLLSGDISARIVRFLLLCGPHIENPVANDPNTLDLDVACVTMLSLDLPTLFGIMALPACRRIPVMDLPEFSDWLHVISDHIVVRVFAGSTNEDMEALKASLVDILRMGFSLTLTCATDNITLSTSQVNVPVPAISKALYTLRDRLCRVCFFGMNWSITCVEPAIDCLIR